MVWDSGRRSIILDQDDFIDMGLQSGDSMFNVDAHTV